MRKWLALVLLALWLLSYLVWPINPVLHLLLAAVVIAAVVLYARGEKEL